MMSYLKKSNSFDHWFTQKENLAQGHGLLNCGWRFVDRNSGGGIQVTACLCTFLACQPVGNHMTRALSASATLRRHSYTEDYQGYFHQHGQQKCRDQRPQHALAGNHHLWTFTSHDGCLPYANGQFTRQCAVSATKQLNIYLCLSVQVISPFFQAGIGRRDNSRLSPCQTRRPEVGHPYPPELTAKRKLILNSIRNY